MVERDWARIGCRVWGWISNGGEGLGKDRVWGWVSNGEVGN